MQAESVQLPGRGFAVEALGNALCSQAESATPHRPVSASWTSASFERLRKHVLCVMGSGDSTAPCRVTSAPCSAPTLLIPLPVACAEKQSAPLRLQTGAPCSWGHYFKNCVKRGREYAL